MKPIPEFGGKSKSFWACVRSLSQHIGYGKRDSIVVPTIDQMIKAFDELGLDTTKITNDGAPTEFANDLLRYFRARSKALTEYVEPRLMTGEQAHELFKKKKRELSPRCPVPMNKQKGDKKAEAFLTGLVNMMVEANIGGDLECDYDPRELTTITRDGVPVRTLARRVDGAFPNTINPIAVWEIKEYYYTTTFGSRVADGVYETLLDGLELEELRVTENIDVKHYLMIDAHYTWWKCGKSYLCRIFDMLHMGYVDEVFFGKEVVECLPDTVKEWAAEARRRNKHIQSDAEL